VTVTGGGGRGEAAGPAGGSSTNAPGTWAGTAGCAWALAYVPVHVYWAVRGSAAPFGDLPPSVRPSQWRQANWAACVVITAAAVLSLALVRPWGRRLPRWMLLGTAWLAAVFAIVHWISFSAATLLQMLGVGKGAVTTFDRWNLLVFEPWFLGMGVLLALAAVQRSRRQPGVGMTPSAVPRSPGGTVSATLVLAGAFVVLVGVMTFNLRAYAVAGPGLVLGGLLLRLVAGRSRRRA
jgi:hypothetical protein